MVSVGARTRERMISIVTIGGVFILRLMIVFFYYVKPVFYGVKKSHRKMFTRQFVAYQRSIGKWLFSKIDQHFGHSRETYKRALANSGGLSRESTSDT